MIHNFDYVEIEQRLSQILTVSPTGMQADEEFLLGTLQSLPTVRLFTRHAKDPEWLHWLDAHKVLDDLFDTQTRLTEEAKFVTRWVAEQFVITHHTHVCELLHKHGGNLNPEFWYWIVDELAFHRNKPRPPEVLAIWTSILLRDVPPPEGQQKSLDNLLTHCQWPEDNYPIIALLSHLLAPTPISERGVDFVSTTELQTKYEFRVSLRGDDYWLHENWQRLTTHVAHFWRVLRPTVEKYLTDTQFMNTSFGKDPDTQSFWRSAIEPHEQDQDTGKAFDVLIDAARDILKYLLSTREWKIEGLRTVESWFASDVTLLQRIAIHGVAIGDSWTPDQKIDWLLTKDLIYEHRFKHEVFQVIKNAISTCNEPIVAKLVEVALTKKVLPDETDETKPLVEYERFTLIAWMSEHASESTVVSAAMQEMLKANPKLKRREYPDLDHWSSGAHLIVPQSPVKPQELVGQTIPEATKLLVEYQGRHEILDGEDRRGLLETLTSAVISNFEWSTQLASYLGRNEHLKGDVWYHLIHGWSKTALSEAQWLTIIDILESYSRIHVKTQAACELIESASKQDAEIPDNLLTKMEELSDIIWDQLEQLPEGEYYESGWLTKAINHGSGHLCEFWIQTLHRRRSGTGKQWTIIPDDYKRRFEKVTSGKSYSAQLARCVLGSRLHYVYHMDESWVTANLLPAFDFERDRLTANQVWHGFLTWGQLDFKLSQAMKPLYRKAINNLVDRSSEELRKQLFRHITDIVLMGMRPDPDWSWFYEVLSQRGTTDEDRLQVVTRIWQTVREAEPGFRESIWNKLLKPLWSDRLAGKPVALSKDESNRLIECVPRLPEVFAEAVDMACETTGFAFPYTHLYADLKDSKLPETHAKNVARLLVHLLKDEKYTNQGHYLIPLHDRLTKMLDPSELRELKNILVGLGVISALGPLEDPQAPAPDETA